MEKTKMSPEMMATIRKTVDEFNAKIEKEEKIAIQLFHGLHRQSPPQSAELALFYKSLGNSIPKLPNREGQMIEHPTVEQLEQYCKNHNILFNDWEFKPCEDSLYRLRNRADEKPANQRMPITWKRPNEFFKNDKDQTEVVLFNTIEPNDIKQGMLGDCWLMCSLAALAEFPQAVKDCFVGDEDRYSPQGVYEVRLYKEGIEEIIQLDDYIPCYPLKGPIYSKANGHELWVLLLEKAFAKYNGSYATLAAGKPFEALIDLTGMPWYEFRFSDQQVQTTIADGSLFQRLMRYDQEGFIMTITTPGLDTQSASAHREGGPATGILPGHAYTLIDAARLSNGAKLLYIRNPWGNFEWTGDWGDTSLLWTKERVDEMTKMGYDMTPKSDGAFWISFEDVVTNFSCINVVLLSNPKREKIHNFNVRRETFWFNFGDENSFGLETNMYQLIVKQDGEFFFSVHQKDKRVLTSPGYFDFGVTILKHIARTDKFEFVASSGYSAERQLQCDVDHLSCGEYWVIPMSTGTKMMQFKNRAIQNKESPILRRSAGLAVHSLAKYSLELLNKSSYSEEVISLAMECAVELPVIESQKIEKKDVYGDGSLVVCNLRSGYAGRSYAVINHTDQDKYSKKYFYEVTLDLSASFNVVSFGPKSCSVIVAPGETEILNHAFPEGESATFTVAASRSQRKLKKDEITAYLASQPLIKERLDHKGIRY